MVMPNCIVCNDRNCKQADSGELVRYDCPRCGIFLLADSAKAELPGKFAQDPMRRSLMSHALRRMQRRDEAPPKILSYDLPSFWQGRSPTPQQQADNLLLWIGDNQPTQFQPLEATVPVL